MDVMDKKIVVLENNSKEVKVSIWLKEVAKKGNGTTIRAFCKILT